MRSKTASAFVFASATCMGLICLVILTSARAVGVKRRTALVALPKSCTRTVPSAGAVRGGLMSRYFW